MIKPEYKRAIYQFADIPEPRGDVSDVKMLTVIAEALAVISLQIHFCRSMIDDKETKDERRQALTKYEAAKFDAMAWPDDAAHSRFYCGRYW